VQQPRGRGSKPHANLSDFHDVLIIAAHSARTT
jgi:hypothetical protein